MIMLTPEAVHLGGVGSSYASTRIERFVDRRGTAQNSKNVREPTLLYLARHCQSSGQEPDAPLTALGRQQADQLGAWLLPRGIVRIVSSPYLRARQSVEPLARQLGIAV